MYEPAEAEWNRTLGFLMVSLQ